MRLGNAAWPREIEPFAVADDDTTEAILPSKSLADEQGPAFLQGIEKSTLREHRLFNVLGRSIGPDTYASYGRDRAPDGRLQLNFLSLRHDVEVARSLAGGCRTHSLCETGGSDCHGGFVGCRLGFSTVDAQDPR